MSLLIKALDKAQAEKAQTKRSADRSQDDKASGALSLEAVEQATTSQPNKPETDTAARRGPLDNMSKARKGSKAQAAQKTTSANNSTITAPAKQAHEEQYGQPVRARAQAANVFTAKQSETKNHTSALVVLVGLIALVVMGALAYWYQSVFNAPDIVIPPRPAVKQEMPTPLPKIEVANELPVSNKVEAFKPEVVEITALEIDSEEPSVFAKVTTPRVVSKTVVAKVEQLGMQQASPAGSAPVKPALEDTLTDNETVVNQGQMTPGASEVVTDLGMATDSASIILTRQHSVPGVNPVLMRAYEAYQAGNDHQAQQDYKQVLERYGPNVDAMLGLGAIATRQERLADANGWYQKVLEVEPRNEIAKSGLLTLQQGQTGQAPVSESNIKSMIATSPNDANLHAALGDLYANQQQWSLAQQAYFDAYRFNPSAENTFNLGVSLDQLGKSMLALPYYREALQKAVQSNVIDDKALQARITSIELQGQ